MPIAREFAVVAPLSAHLERPIVVVDVGCRWGFAQTWSALEPHVRLIGFDPDAEECARLERTHQGSAGVQFVPMGLGRRRGRKTLHLTREPACSSLYPPDTRTMHHRPELGCIEPAGTATIGLTTLDRWAAAERLGRIDVIKLDTQGSELGILQGGKRMLAGVRVLEIEVEFNEIYRGQPLFGDVDRFLRGCGFVLWRLGHLVHYGMADAASAYAAEDRQFFDSRGVAVPAQGGQIYWGHAYYVPESLAFGTARAGWRDNLRDACCVSAFGFRDLAGSALNRALADAPEEVAVAIRSALDDGVGSTGPEA